MSARCASESCSAAATPRHMAGPSLPSATRTFSTTAVATNLFTLVMLVSAALRPQRFPSASRHKTQLTLMGRLKGCSDEIRLPERSNLQDFSEDGQ